MNSIADDGAFSGKIPRPARQAISPLDRVQANWLFISATFASAGEVCLIAGTCFILSAALMVASIGWLYVRFGRLPATAGILYEIKPVVIGVVLQVLWSLGRTAVKATFLGLVAVLTLVLSVLGLYPLLLLLLAGGVVCVPALRTSRVSFSVLPFLTIGGGIFPTIARLSAHNSKR